MEHEKEIERGKKEYEKRVKEDTLRVERQMKDLRGRMEKEEDKWFEASLPFDKYKEKERMERKHMEKVYGVVNEKQVQMKEQEKKIRVMDEKMRYEQTFLDRMMVSNF